MPVFVYISYANTNSPQVNAKIKIRNFSRRLLVLADSSVCNLAISAVFANPESRDWPRLNRGTTKIRQIMYYLSVK